MTDKQGGCFYDADASYTLRQSKHGFKHGKILLSAAELEHLREVLLAVEDGRDTLLQSLGITEQKIQAQRNTIIEAALKGDSVTPRALPEEIDRLLELDTVKAMIFNELDAADDGSVMISTSWCSFTVELPGDPVLVASSSNCRAWMLPWTIRAGDREWRTWSTTVPEALRPLASKKSPNAHLLDGTRYWQQDFWSDTAFWRGTLRYGVGQQLNADYAHQLAMRLDGWSEASTKFNLIQAETGLINSCPLSLALTLEPTHVALIDRVRWYNTLANGVPTVSWDKLLDIWKEAEAVVAEHPWLADWRAQNGRVWLVVHDTFGYGCSPLDTWVLPAWRDAGLSGKPDFELSLSAPRSGHATVYLGRNESNSVITYAGFQEKGAHWLYHQQLSFHPLKPDYLFVTSDGRAEHRMVGGHE